MDKTAEAVLKIQSGDLVEFETSDCFDDAIQKETDLISEIDFNCVNPATGPVFVEGAEPGDVLKVDIVSIDLNKQGAAVACPGLGRLGDQTKEEETVIVKIEDDHLVYKGIEIELNKMIGVIGTAPEGEAVNNGTPGPHGGNMDCTMVREGSSVYLPVNVPGALLAIGDLHAAMGDGEINGAGAEISGKVKVKVEVLKDFPYQLPMIETKDRWITVASADTMEKASDLAIHHMIELIMKKTDLTMNQAAMLLSIAGDLRVCQIVNPQVTMRMEVRKSHLS